MNGIAKKGLLISGVVLLTLTMMSSASAANGDKCPVLEKQKMARMVPPPPPPPPPPPLPSYS